MLEHFCALLIAVELGELSFEVKLGTKLRQLCCSGSSAGGALALKSDGHGFGYCLRQQSVSLLI